MNMPGRVREVVGARTNKGPFFTAPLVIDGVSPVGPKVGPLMRLGGPLFRAWEAEGSLAVARTVLRDATDTAAITVGRLRNRAFDRKHDVSTAGDVALATLGLDEAELAGTTGLYRPIESRLFHAALQAVPVDHRQFTFVDYGSGKGKALLLAAGYPFRRILGVEQVRSLHQAAEENIRRYRGPAHRCQDVRAVHGDARRFTVPDGPLVAFFFDAFAPPVLAAVLDRIARSVALGPRPVFVVSVNARPTREGDPFFGDRPSFVAVARDWHHVVYRLDPGLVELRLLRSPALSGR
jgi:hypothetical protein